ncbi:energy-coupling factor transport system permease protein [Marinilactibacillus piezotolerans]|uniref:Energy-coupling factor transporter transmembrane protein EcfT n=1 Tax=Marinilactibacillus piezotolerans TaxID=258723 RepID=A0A1I3WM37_9LACT|nr:energy-coupling factor transporter transmembrane component T [Marinilactibacillus piezotolerans]SFK07521.1 energy-coupling factor transport system permease protein [Marinilactibacillus piezotolerans]
MMDKLIFGRYIPGNSLIHRLDPRTKLMSAILFIIVIFFANNIITYLALALFVGLAVALSKISVRFFINGIKPLIWLILFTVILQILFTSGETIFFRFGPIILSQEGLINGGFIFMRFVLIIFMSTLLTLTTMPLSLSDAIEYLLRPLAVIKVPVHEIALMLSIALRFVPTLMDETEKIMNAQRARGIDFGEGNIYEQMKSVVPLLIPLFVSSFNRAEELATAMEARGYKGGEGRTKYRQLSWQTKDTLAMVSFGVLTALLLLLRT